MLVELHIQTYNQNSVELQLREATKNSKCRPQNDDKDCPQGNTISAIPDYARTILQRILPECYC